jgi:hypothetical protein
MGCAIQPCGPDQDVVVAGLSYAAQVAGQEQRDDFEAEGNGLAGQDGQRGGDRA